MKQRIYIYTSVIGGCLDPEFSQWSNFLFEEINKGLKTPAISDITREEISKAPLKVKKILDALTKENIENVDLSEEAENLAKQYIVNKVVSKKHIADAHHIAIATINKVDILVSWNFKHIVNINRIHNFNSVNLRCGYSLLEIRTPREVLENG